MRGIGTATLALLAVAAIPSTAAAKCQATTMNPVLPGYALIVDGELRGEYATEEEATYPPSEQILTMEVACLRALRSPDPRARQSAVVVITRRGAPRVLKSYLSDLVEAQADYRERTGEYAADLADLDFLATHITVPMEMSVGEAGWWAVATVPGSNSTCQVAIGSAAREARFQRGPRARPGTPVCLRS